MRFATAVRKQSLPVRRHPELLQSGVELLGSHCARLAGHGVRSRGGSFRPCSSRRDRPRGRQSPGPLRFSAFVGQCGIWRLPRRSSPVRQRVPAIDRNAPPPSGTRSRRRGLYETGLHQAAAKCGDQRAAITIERRRTQVPDHRHRALLRVRRARPRRPTA